MQITDETLDRVARSRFCTGLPGYRGRGLRDRIRRSLAGDMDADILASTRWKVAERHVSMDIVSAAILSHYGINPAVAAIIAIMASTAEFDQGDSRWVVTDTAVLAPLGGIEAAMWISRRSSIVSAARIPETIAMRAPGLPLRQLLSHPALDPLPLTVAHVASRDHEGTIWIEEPDACDLATYIA